jgi:N-acetylneuraminic acid mutarotase
MKKASSFICFIFAIGFCAAGLGLPAEAGNARADTPRTLSLEERIAWHRKVEAVYWQHRVWQSPQAKPALDEVFPPPALQAKVEDGLRKANALEALFNRPITADQLRAEVDRITAQTRNPKVLRELFAALENDSFLIAEIIARPALTEAALQDSYFAARRAEQESKDAVEPESERDHAGFVTWWQEHKAGFSTDVRTTAPSFALPNITSGENDSWAPMAAPPVGGREASSVWTGVEVIVWNSNVSGSRYNPTLDMSFPVTRTNAPPPRTTHSAIWTGSEMIVWGGHAGVGSGDPFRVGWRYNPITDSWTQTTAANAPAARDAHVAVWTGSEMIVWGGWDPNGANLTSGGRYNPANDTWAPTTQANTPQGRLRARAVWTGQEMIVWGGTTSNVGAQDTGGRYNPQTDTWTATSTVNAPAPRFNHTAVWTGSEMIVWGGNSNIIFNSGGRYNPATDSWAATSASPLEARRQHTAVWTGSEMIIWGGCVDFQCSNSRETGARYNPANDSWTPTATLGNNNNRSNHAAVWTGSEMIITGGCRSGECQRSIENIIRYTPSGDTWREARYEPLPIPPRQPHKAVWTGTEMLVWGVDASMFDTSVYRYNPVTNRWTRTFVLGAPDARYDFSLVWTGTEMIVWGGDVQGIGVTRTGGRFNPMTNVWTETNIDGAPTSRFLHEAVWTGTEMIIWGGARENGTTTNTGARYNPGTNTWTAMATTNAPTGRVFGSSIWTGQEMVVWGGSDLASSTYFNTGGRYNPATNAWTATSLANAPSPRNSHTAVWTGQEMIVWGGRDGAALFNTGARYNVATNAWVATNVVGAPAPRWIHTAVWTGDEMIVWGGLVNSEFPFQSTNTGARYNPGNGAWTATPSPARTGAA